MLNKVVVHFLNSRILKGTTSDFFPNKQFFHLVANQTNEIHKVDISDLKAIFFVRTYEGDPEYEEKQDVERTGLGKKVRIHFKDGEVLFGYTQGYSPDRLGFSVVPSDPKSNNERIFVNKGATNDVTFVGEETSTKGLDKRPDVDTAEEDLIIICPSCGVKNKLKTSILELKPRCGKCKTRLV